MPILTISVQGTLAHLIYFAISHQQNSRSSGSASVSDRNPRSLRAEQSNNFGDRIQPTTLNNSIITPKYISVNRTKSFTQLQYKSAIAFQLAKDDPQCSLEFAKQILQGISLLTATDVTQMTTSLVLHDLDYDVIPPGWIYITLGHRGIAAWLQSLHQISLRDTLDPLICCPKESSSLKSQLSKSESSLNQKGYQGFPQGSSAEFQVQYTHARCCFLLHQSIFAEVSFRSENLPNLASIQSILAEYVSFDTFLVDKAMWRLLVILVDVLDQIVLGKVQQTPGFGLKLANQLSQAFLEFERWVQIRSGRGSRGVQATISPEELALIWITQQILQALLETRFGWVAPTHL